MESITGDVVSEAIDKYLDASLQEKLKPALKKLEKAASGSSSQAQKAEEEVAKLRERFSKPVWLANAANNLAWRIQFGTHISKGIHPGSKGDNINFRPEHPLPEGLVGSQLRTHSELDAGRNAAALPLATFFNIDVKGGTRLRDLILANHPALAGVFADNPELSRQREQTFSKALAGKTEKPVTDARNKQLFWPMEEAKTEDRYRCLVPLHPSALTYEVFRKVERRSSEENKAARDNRKKKNIEQKPYVSIVSLAALNLGGSNPQNASLLMAKQTIGKQKGVNFLLESLPPTYTRQHEFSLGKRQENFFNENLAYHCYFGLQELYGVVEAPKSVMAVRDQRKQALGLILGQILQLAAYVQSNYPAGWSEASQLKMAHKYWLDPHRAMLEGQETFKEAREQEDWVHTVKEDFSAWLNNRLRKRFKKQATDFDDDEYWEWLREMESAIKASQRAREGIF